MVKSPNQITEGRKKMKIPVNPINEIPNELRSVRQLLTDAVSSEPEHISYMYRDGDKVVSVTTREFYNSVEALGASITRLGYGKSHIACVGENSYPWIQTFLTVLMSGGVYVPLDKELPVDSLIFLINDSDSELVFCSEKYEQAFISRRSEMPKVKNFVCFTRKEDDGDFLSFEKLINEGKDLPKDDFDALKVDEHDLKYLVYTSGTTGIAKGVMLTEHNVCSGVYYGLMRSKVLTRGLSVLPYNHTYEAVCDLLVAIRSHATICINDNIKRIQENLKLFKPDYIMLVPAFAEFFCKTIQNGIRKKGMTEKLNKIIKMSNGLRKVGIDLRRKLFASILEQLGGELRKIVCGGAPIRPETGKFFDDIGISMTGGYGITECSPLVSVNDDKDNNFSSAGRRIPCLEWRIDTPDADGIGEVCVKGDVVMKGYYKRPDLTAEAIRDGWFFTGDFGYINSKDEIVLTGRKKNIIVLSNGKNVYPEEIENYIQGIPYVTEVIVSGISNEHGQDVGLKAEIYVSDPEADKSNIVDDVKKALAELPGYKQMSSVVLRDEPFAKTTTNKIKRNY